jgi:hypothetical protein
MSERIDKPIESSALLPPARTINESGDSRIYFLRLERLVSVGGCSTAVSVNCCGVATQLAAPGNELFGQ